MSDCHSHYTTTKEVYTTRRCVQSCVRCVWQCGTRRRRRRRRRRRATAAINSEREKVEEQCSVNSLPKNVPGTRVRHLAAAESRSRNCLPYLSLQNCHCTHAEYSYKNTWHPFDSHLHFLLMTGRMLLNHVVSTSHVVHHEPCVSPCAEPARGEEGQECCWSANYM
jgi:hypothetical protein